MTGFTRRQAVVGSAAMAGGLALPARAAGYPERDITFINPWSMAGSLGVILRQYCRQMEKELGGKVILESRTGGSGTIGVGLIARAKPDGYTFGEAGAPTLTYQPQVIKGLPWKRSDLDMIGKLSEMPAVVAVRADSPIKNWNDLMAAAKASPNQVRVGVGGLRTSADLEFQQINRIANVKFRTVPFTGGTGEAIIALLGGRIDAVTSYTEAFKGHVQAGTMRVVAAMKKGSYDPFPDATPVGDQPGLADALLPTSTLVIAPKGIPKDIFDKLVNATQNVVTGDEWKAFAKRGGLVLDPRTPAQLQADLDRLDVMYERLIKTLNTT